MERGNTKRILGESLRKSTLNTAETTFAFSVNFDRVDKLRFAEIWPEHLGDVELCIAELPEEKIREAHLTASSDHQIRVREVASVKMLAEDISSDHRAVQMSLLHALDKAFDPIDNLFTPRRSSFP